MKDPTTRFSDRVDNYIKYRPSYPPALIQLLREECGLNPDSVVADIGSGTGILTQLLLETGCRVLAVEPNKEMREAAERLLGSYPGFVSIDGRSEQTGLPEQSVDIITAAQAFHWFDQERTRTEFRRILRRDGSCLLVWNERLVDASPFQAEYESLIRKYARDYEQVNHSRISEDEIAAFFHPAIPNVATFPNEQRFDFEGLKGRLLSSSYVPNQDDPQYHPMLHDLKALFEQHAQHGLVTIEYSTIAHYAR